MSNYKLADKRYKTNIKPIEDALEIIGKIYGYTFEWNETRQNDFEGEDIGFIAQEVMGRIPTAVKKEDKKLVLNSVEFLPFIVQSIHELHNQNTELRKEVEQLKLDINSIKTFYKIEDEEL
jgi:hypothetical protein